MLQIFFTIRVVDEISVQCISTLNTTKTNFLWIVVQSCINFYIALFHSHKSFRVLFPPAVLLSFQHDEETRKVISHARVFTTLHKSLFGGKTKHFCVKPIKTVECPQCINPRVRVLIWICGAVGCGSKVTPAVAAMLMRASVEVETQVELQTNLPRAEQGVKQRA